MTENQLYFDVLAPNNDQLITAMLDLYIDQENSCLSLTPPSSPVEFADEPDEELEFEQNDHGFSVASFTCLGECVISGNYHENGYLESGHFERLFVNAGEVYGDPLREYKIFGHYWPTGLNVEDVDRIFLILRQTIGCLQGLSKESVREGQRLRKDVNRCLEYLLIQVRDKHLLDTKVADTLLGGVHNVLADIGRISEISRNELTECWFHTHLDVYWRLLCIAHFIQTNYKDCVEHLCTMPEDSVSYPIYDQLLHTVLWDLVTVAISRNPEFTNGPSRQNSSLFPCMCVKELYSLCIRLSQIRVKELNGEFFWLSLHKVIKVICDWNLREKEDIFERDDCTILINPPEDFNVEDPTGTCLWILSNVAPVYIDHKTESGQGSKTYVSNYHDLQTIVKQFLSSSSVSENALRRYLQDVLYITSYWEPNSQLLIELWEYFYKRIDDTFHEGTNPIHGLAYIDKTVTGFYGKCKQWSSRHQNESDNLTSFHLFLSIISQQLSGGDKHSNSRIWKQLKGRIYSKFYQKRIQELGEVGLFNLTCMFLTLGITANLEEVTTKLCEFYDMFDIERISRGMRSVIWLGVFTLMLIHVNNETDISFMAERMASSMEHLVGEFQQADTSSRQGLWEMINLYLDGMLEVVDTSKNLCRSESSLIGPFMTPLLSSASENQLRHVLFAVQTVISKLRQVVRSSDKPELVKNAHEEDQQKDFADRLWKYGYKFIVQHACTLTPPVEIADVASEFCLLALTNPPSFPMKETFVSIFQSFADGEKINPSIQCRFLGHLLNQSEVTSRLATDLNQWEAFVIRCWFHCCALVPGPSEILNQVTRSTLQLEEVKAIYRQASFEIGNLEDCPIQFLKALSKAHDIIESWSEKMQFQLKIIPYFTDLHKYVMPVLRNPGQHAVLTNMYRIVGNFVKYCAKLVYIKQDTVIPSILTSMILPQQVMDKDKPMSPMLLAVIRDTLYLFLQGLGRLAYDRDLFVQRRLKDIVLIYLPKFTIKSSSNHLGVVSVHPVVASLSASYIQKPSEDAIKFRLYVTQIVIDNFIVVKNMSVHPQHTMGWTFLTEVSKRTSCNTVYKRDFPAMLQICLEYLLLLPEQSSILSNVLCVLQNTAQAHSDQLDVHSMSKPTKIIQDFIKTYRSFSLLGILKVMEKLAVLHKDIVISVISDMTTAVREIENKRGVGADQNLRLKYFKVLQVLGDKGQEEMAKLKPAT